MEAILRRTTPLSQRAEDSPLWLGTFPKRRSGGGTTRNSRLRCRQGKRGCASRVSPSPGATARRTREMLVVRATPLFSALVRHGGGARVEARVETRSAPFAPPCGEVALTTMIPGGKASGRPVAVTVDECFRV